MAAKQTGRKPDRLPAAGEGDQTERDLVSLLERAKEEEDYASYVLIGNEMITYYRSVLRFQEALDRADDVLLLLEELQLDGSAHFADTLLNAAAACREAGQPRQAYRYDAQALAIYERTASGEDFRIAELCSDMGMLLQQLGEQEQAEKLFARAVTLFEAAGEGKASQPGYGAALMGVAEICAHRGDYENALHSYEQALETVRRQFGSGEGYALLCENCAAVCERLKNKERASGYRRMAAEARGLEKK